MWPSAVLPLHQETDDVALKFAVLADFSSNMDVPKANLHYWQS